MSPKERAELYASLCVNTGKAGHAIALDMHMEHLVCILKRLLKRSASNLDVDLLERYSKALPLLRFVESEVNSFWKPPRPTTYRTCRDLSCEVDDLARSEMTTLNDGDSAFKKKHKFGSVFQRVAKMHATQSNLAPGAHCEEFLDELGDDDPDPDAVLWGDDEDEFDVDLVD